MPVSHQPFRSAAGSARGGDDDGLGHVGDHRERAFEVAADGGVTHRFFSDMSPVWRKRAPAVLAQFHMREARRRAWMFWRVDAGGLRSASIALRRFHFAVEGVVDRHHAQLDTSSRQRVAAAVASRRRKNGWAYRKP